MQGTPDDTPITTQAVRNWWPVAVSILVAVASVVTIYQRFDGRIAALETASAADGKARHEMLGRIRNMERLLTIVVCTQQGSTTQACREAIDAIGQP